MADPIKHVVALILENHSFDQMLGALKAVYPELEGVDPKNPGWNEDKSGKRFEQAETRESQMLHDPFHEHVDVAEQLSDGNKGFIKNFEKHYSGSSDKEKAAIMGYYPLDFLPALHPLARSFRICDHWFSSLPGPTWPNRMFALSGTSMGSTRMPEAGDTEVAMVGNQTQETIFDRLSEAGRRWNIFFYDFPSSLLLQNLRKPERSKNYAKIDAFFEAARGREADFPDFALIEPKYYGLDQNDDHPPHNVMKAQKLTADVYNAIRANGELWRSTLLVVFYDEHGGFFDHVVPGPADPPDGHHEEYDFTQYGVRVPALLISPWVRPGVEKTLFDHTSLLRYLIDKWNLKPLTVRSSKANSIIQNSWLDAPLAEDKCPRFLRVPYSDLIPAHPEWELGDVSVHHTALDALASNLEDRAEAGLAEKAMLLSLRLQAKVGNWMAGVGRALAQKSVDHQAARVEAAVRKALPGIDQWGKG